MIYIAPVKYIMRIVNVSISLYLSYISFDLFYEKFMTFVPSKESLNQLNTHIVGTSLSPLLRENSAGFRELYYHAYEKSLLFSFIVFISCIVVIEYVYRANRHKMITKVDKIVEDIVENAPLIVEEVVATKTPKVPVVPNYSKDFFNTNKTP